ncbi:uncharacterized protein LOC130814048 [Amaranthus tricolor]|uniref:uncharacterized protein LOC130814048 n=1 Tax=Amaranthus tricolor TaxID=29722 RepID=UPI0025846F95|nr:uncharacterized protein LOC130814048 [Amaranthus tricolor]
MMKFRRFYNGAQTLYFTHHFRHLQLYSSSTSNNPKFVNYLVEAIGFSNKEALSASNKLAHSRQIRGLSSRRFQPYELFLRDFIGLRSNGIGWRRDGIGLHLQPYRFY